MAVDLQLTFRSGGKPLLDLLDYCVRSVQIDPLFLFLAQEYRNGPTALKAVALYELFCAPTAPAKISASKLSNFRLQESVTPLKASLQSGSAPPGADPESNETRTLPRPVLPPKYLFELVESAVLAESEALIKIERHYEPGRTPTENLPDGKMTMAQRHFVEKVWQPTIRPRLVEAGFWRVSSVG